MTKSRAQLIGFDATPLQIARHSGVGNYTAQLLTALIDRADERPLRAAGQSDAERRSAARHAGASGPPLSQSIGVDAVDAAARSGRGAARCLPLHQLASRRCTPRVRS